MFRMFKRENSAIQSMIANKKEAVARDKIDSENAQKRNNLDTGKLFSQYTDAKFAQS
ncbi:hypothetical protein JT207_03450, partial [Helicobacter pylori]|nr:hypothetical protein [Helicobacter pylori]